MRTSWWPIAGALIVGTVLLVTSLFIRRSVHDASDLVVRGISLGLSAEARGALRGIDWPPAPEVLQGLLDDQAENGLRYVAVVTPRGELLAAVGTEQLGTGGPGDVRSGELVMKGSRARVVHPLPVRMTRQERLQRIERGLRAERPRRPRALLVMEFEPVQALALQSEARNLLIVSILSFAGVLGMGVVLWRVLSQRERMQAELERGRRLAALGEMSAVLAHELKNPLASLKGHAQLLAETVEGDPKLGPRADRLVNESVRLERLLTDLLAFVRSGELQWAEADPDQVLRAAVDAVDPARIDVVPLGTGGAWRMDAGRIQQALENLLRNAVQASPDGARVQARVEAGPGTRTFVVRDLGTGVAPGDEERIFEPFVTRKVRGVGLGLAITRRIVEQHGGTVTVRNHSEGGAEFRLALPERRS